MCMVIKFWLNKSYLLSNHWKNFCQVCHIEKMSGKEYNGLKYRKITDWCIGKGLNLRCNQFLTKCDANTDTFFSGRTYTSSLKWFFVLQGYIILKSYWGHWTYDINTYMDKWSAYFWLIRMASLRGLRKGGNGIVRCGLLTIRSPCRFGS